MDPGIIIIVPQIEGARLLMRRLLLKAITKRLECARYKVYQYILECYLILQYYDYEVSQWLARQDEPKTICRCKSIRYYQVSLPGEFYVVPYFVCSIEALPTFDSIVGEFGAVFPAGMASADSVSIMTG